MNMIFYKIFNASFRHKSKGSTESPNEGKQICLGASAGSCKAPASLKAAQHLDRDKALVRCPKSDGAPKGCTLNVNRCNHYGKQYGRFLKRLKIELPDDLAIPLLGIYPEKNHDSKRYMPPMFISALFTITKTWNPPKCPSTDEWIKKMWYIYTMEYYSTTKK